MLFVVWLMFVLFVMLDLWLIEVVCSFGVFGWMFVCCVVLLIVWLGIVVGIVLCFLLMLNEFGILFVFGSVWFVMLLVVIYSSVIVDFDLLIVLVGVVVMLMLLLVLYVVYCWVNWCVMGGNDVC